MAAFEPFDLARAYIDAENVLRSRTLREEAAKRTEIDAQALADEQRKAAEEQEIRMLLEPVRAGNPQAIERMVGRIAERDPQLARWFAENPGALARTMEQGLGMTAEKPTGPELRTVGDTLLRVPSEGQPEVLYQAPEKDRAPTVIVPPSSQREFEWFQTLTPEQQDAFLNMRRANATPEIAAATAGAKTAAIEGAKTAAAAQADLPRMEANATEMLGVLDKLGRAEGFDIIYGLGAFAPIVPGTSQADAYALWEQVKGKAFLEAFNTLKGGGQITEKEGEKATAAITRLSNRKQSPAAAREALADLKSVVRAATERARKKAAGPQPQPTGKRLRFDAQGNEVP